MIHVEVIDTFNKFLKLEPIWNNLVSMNEIDIPFLTFEWFSCWWNSYGDNKELLILIAKQDGEILGIAPFMITKTIFRCLPVRKISFLTDGYSNRADFILIKNKKEALSHIFKYLNSNYKFNLISCNYLLSGSSSDTILGELLTESNSKYKRNNVFLSPYILIDANWNNYLNNRSRSFRKKLKRIDNLFKRNGSYEIIKYSMNDIEKGMDELLCVSKNSWKHKKLTAIACNAKDIKFYSLLSKIASLKGWLNIWILRMNCKPIAFEFNLFYKERYYSLKIGFDEMYGSFSPGVFLDNYVLKECFATGAKEFDLLGKNEEYKMRWANSSREHCQYYIFNNRVYGRMLCFLECRLTSSIKKILALVNYPILLKIYFGINKINKYANIKYQVNRAYKSGGSINVLYRTFNKIRLMVFRLHRSYWYAMDLFGPIENITPGINVTINFGAMFETLEWERESRDSGDFSCEELREINIAQKNNHCYINIKDSNKIIGFLKVGFDKVYFKEYKKTIDIPENIAFIYDTFIHRDYRGLGIAPYMINETMKRLAKSNLEFAMCHIIPTNLASQKAYSKVGFKRIGFIWHIKLFIFRIFNFSPEKLMKKFSWNAYGIKTNSGSSLIIDLFT